MALQSWLGVVITTLAVTFVVFQPSKSAVVILVTAQWNVDMEHLWRVCVRPRRGHFPLPLVAGDIPPLLGALIRLTIGVLAVMLVIPFVEKKPLCINKRDLWAMTKLDKLWLLGAMLSERFSRCGFSRLRWKMPAYAITQTLIWRPVWCFYLDLCSRRKVSKQSVIGRLSPWVGFLCSSINSSVLWVSVALFRATDYW